MAKAERRPARREGMRERALRHVVRRLLLELLREAGELSPREMRERLRTDAPLSVVSYHARILQEAGLIESAGGSYRLAPGISLDRGAPPR